MRPPIAHHLLRSQSRVILEVHTNVRLWSHAPCGLASNCTLGGLTLVEVQTY